MPVDASTAAREWLAAADPNPDHAHRWMGAVQIVLLPLGTMWDAVKAPSTLAMSAVRAGILTGPIVADAGALFFLVPVGTHRTWNVIGTECLGTACYLATPAPERTSPPGPHWLQPPDGSGQLVDAAALRAALEAR